MTVAALKPLRQFGHPASATGCARVMLSRKGVPKDDPRATSIAFKMAAILSRKAASGQVRRIGNGDGRHVVWEIARRGLR